jgi:crossover junction endodeoxyribonuclease RusA
MRITVNGIPAPQGSKRAYKTKTGKINMVESSKSVGSWREAVRAETQRALGSRPPLGGPVRVELAFYMTRPKGHYRTGRNAHLTRDGAPAYPAGKPDLDKLCRAVLDGLTAGGAWKDDSQVVQLHLAKLYAADAAAQCIITFYEMGTPQ